MSKVFNRKDPQVRRDAIDLPEETFLTKYTASFPNAGETVLKTVYASFEKERKAADAIDKNATQGADLVETGSFKADDGDTITLKTNKKTGQKIAEVETNLETLKGATEGKEVKTDKKVGRTPRMRELIKTLGKDKPKVKNALDEEGFDTSGSGFHSEWNRVSKSM